MSSKHEKLAYRLAGILSKLNTGERLDVYQLAEEYGVDVCSIQRDLNERLGFLMWNEQGKRYYSLDKTKIGHLYQQDIERFARFCSIDKQFHQESLLKSTSQRLPI